MFLLAKLCIQHAGVYCLFPFYSTKKKNNPKEYFPLQGHSSWLYNRNVSPCAPRSVKPTIVLLLLLLYNTYQCFLAELSKGLERTNMVSLRCGGLSIPLRAVEFFAKIPKRPQSIIFACMQLVKTKICWLPLVKTGEMIW